MRLLYFDLTQGNRIGIKILFKEFKLDAISMIAKLKYRELFDNPFDKLNASKKPSKNEKLSQRQMAPLVILYRLLKEEGYSQEDALDYCLKISKEVAVAFLDYNVPPIRKKDWIGQPEEKKKRLLQKIANRFFNMTSINKLHPNDKFTIEVTGCKFAQYAKELGVPELGPVFCATDRYYFENFQPDVKFHRTQTLAIDGKPCDFMFTWKD